MKLAFAILIPALLLRAGPPEMLARAIVTGDVETMERLLSTGVDPNARTATGDTPLSLALTFGQPKALDLLLAAHADPNAPLHDRSRAPFAYPPLLYALRFDDLRTVSRLIASGANVNARGARGQTPLHLAVDAQRYDILHLLLEKSADPNVRDDEGAAPLDDAVWRGSTDAVAMLIAHGARLNDPNTQTGATPINEAAYRGVTPLVRFLLELHPDLRVVDKRGRGPLTNAILMGKEDCAVLLMQAQPPETMTPRFLQDSMQAAISKDEGDVVGLLLQSGLPVNARLPDGSTPITTAASSGSIHAMTILLEHGADPSLADGNSATPLENAALKGFAEVATALIERGAEVNHLNEDSGGTALYAASSFGRLPVVKLLLEKGADPTLCGSRSKSPYQAASENGYTDVANELRTRGVACKKLTR
jgi:ankyrin repeat protein